ncbi:hypothetical protein R6Q57_019556, partial [Mikania cordata]
MSLKVNPGPLVNDLLFLRDGHRATHLFNSNDYGDRDPLNFAWTPYDSIMERLPFICRSGEA